MMKNRKEQSKMMKQIGKKGHYEKERKNNEKL